MIDVGAERGAFAAEILRAGGNEVHVIEPEPENAAFLRERFSGEPRATVHEYAASSEDAQLELHKSAAPTGEPISFGHTVLEREATTEIAWPETITVTGRSLASLVRSGEIPARVGILKIDTEGHDLAVVSGMGELTCDVVMVEHWTDLPESLGPCPWSTEEMTSLLSERGFSHFAFIVHRGPFVFLKWDDGEVPRGSMGNLVFLHERVTDRLLPTVLELGSSLAEATVESAEMYSTAADERLRLGKQLEADRDALLAAAEERFALIDELQRECEQRSHLIEQLQADRDTVLVAAEERLALIDELQRECEQRSHLIEQLQAELNMRLPQ
jgi:FkbM family methyltransferase